MLLNDGLVKLGTRNAEAAAIVKLQFFGDLTMIQAADALGLPLRTAQRNWTYARAWLHRELSNRSLTGPTTIIRSVRIILAVSVVS